MVNGQCQLKLSILCESKCITTLLTTWHDGTNQEVKYKTVAIPLRQTHTAMYKWVSREKKDQSVQNKFRQTPVCASLSLHIGNAKNHLLDLGCFVDKQFQSFGNFQKSIRHMHVFLKIPSLLPVSLKVFAVKILALRVK